MTDSNQYALEQIRLRVWAGYDSPDEVKEMLADILEADSDEAMLRRAVDEEFARKREAERGWPAVTDCDRLDAVFAKLHGIGICALGNAGYEMSDGYSDVAEAVAQAATGKYHGYCFYHGQDVERAVDGHGVMIAFGDLKDREPEGLAVGRTVAAALTAAGFKVEWNGTNATRIDLPVFDWKRRGPPGAARISSREPAAAAAKPWWRFGR
jgi:hypothetical protein